MVFKLLNSNNYVRYRNKRRPIGVIVRRAMPATVNESRKQCCNVVLN